MPVHFLQFEHFCLPAAHTDNALSVAVVHDSTTPSGYEGIRLQPWDYAGKLVVGADATDRKLTSLLTSLKRNAKTFGAVMTTYPWLFAACPHCNPQVDQAMISIDVTLPRDWIAPDNRLYQLVHNRVAFDVVVPPHVGAGLCRLFLLLVPVTLVLKQYPFGFARNLPRRLAHVATGPRSAFCKGEHVVAGRSALFFAPS